MLPKEFATKDDIPAFLQEHYTEKDDKWLLNEGVKVENVSALTATVSKLKTKTKLFETHLSDFGKIEIEDGKPKFTANFQPSDHDALKKQIADLEEKLKDADGKDVDINAIVEERTKDRIAAVTASFEKKITDMTGEHTKAQDELMGDFRRVSLNQSRAAEIAKIDGVNQYLDPHLSQIMSLDEERNVVLKDKEGNVMIGVDGKNQTIGAYLQELKDSGDWDDAFKERVPSGPGGDPSAPPRGTPKTIDHGGQMIDAHSGAVS